jgi:DNA repair exonuclease SbcCD ATPase subunit
LNKLLVKKTRRLGEYDEISPSELATMACEFANVSQLATDDCERELDTVVSQISDMEALAESTAVDPDEVIKKCEEVEKIAKEMTEKMEDMMEYISASEQACSDAEQAAEKNDHETAKDALKEAEESAEKVMDYVEDVHKKALEAMKKHKELEEKVMKANREESTERTKRVIEQMKEKNKKKLEELDRKIEDAERAMKEAKSLGEARMINHEKAKLEDLKLQQEMETKALAAAEKEYEEMMKYEAEYTANLASLLLTARYAKDEKGKYILFGFDIFVQLQTQPFMLISVSPFLCIL